MHKKSKTFPRKRKHETDGIPISDASLNDFEKRVKDEAEKNPKVKERLKYILRYLAMIKKHISQNDARRAVFATSFLDYELYNTGFAKPFYMKMASIKGGRADKTKKGIILAIKENLPKINRTSPIYMWRFFEKNYSDPWENTFIVTNPEYQIHFDKKNNLLVQTDDVGRESSIKFKTFERYFYEILKENPHNRR